MTRIPHLHVVIATCLLAVIGYALVSAWVIAVSRDPALTGDTVGTWKSFATLAFGFWIGSSSGGKAKDAQPTEPIQ